MNEQVRGIAWEAYEHHHVEKKSDWYWIVGIAIATFSAVSLLLGNALLGVAILTGGTVMLILAAREPKLITYTVAARGIRIDDKLYPYTTLESFFIDEESIGGPQLLVRSEKLFMPLLILPLPEEYVDDIEDLIAARLPEEHLEEPFANKLLEFFGF
jgi:hypothetical protein